MTYDWEGKEDLCYKMYIIDKKSLEDIMEFYRQTENFTPRYIQGRFFPSYGILHRSSLCAMYYCG